MNKEIELTRTLPCDICPSNIKTECYQSERFWCDKFVKWVNDWVAEKNKELEAQK